MSDIKLPGKHFGARKSTTGDGERIVVLPTGDEVSARVIYASTADPVDATDGSDGDIWLKYTA